MATKITRSPRAPSFTLEDSVKNAIALYEANGKHAIPSDVAAKALGYSGANNGSAARALASLKNFGLLISNNKGDVAVSPDVETYRYAPDEEHRRDLLIHWLRSPKVYSELLDEYHDRLPSDQVIRYRLIKMGFLPSAAEESLKNFRASVDYANYYSPRDEYPPLNIEQELDLPPTHSAPPPSIIFPPIPTQLPPADQKREFPTPQAASAEFDRIPVRLSKGRRAWIEIPNPLYEADKALIKSQIDLILTDDDELA
ncbi:MAG: hypothetical protein FH747_09015 [Stenotrophomonas sp.]|uniref:hypothetical protein n=1 Tax=Stenotrophomonas sp. TaxID=69392 RepID=UPI001352CB4A|nr:hypothetical protein [Stenotrophomonas sp.]MTI73781.1 hypothetical protein [Stenotrophomonas sp.]